MSTWQLSEAEKRAIWAKMRVPVFAFVAALLCFLVAIILIGQAAAALARHPLSRSSASRSA